MLSFGLTPGMPEKIPQSQRVARKHRSAHHVEIRQAGGFEHALKEVGETDHGAPQVLIRLFPGRWIAIRSFRPPEK